jgi:hypothetical protein
VVSEPVTGHKARPAEQSATNQTEGAATMLQTTVILEGNIAADLSHQTRSRSVVVASASRAQWAQQKNAPSASTP